MIRLFSDDALTDNQEGRVDPAYMAEVESQTDRRVREYAAAERRLEAAKKRHQAAQMRAARAGGNAKARRMAQADVDSAWRMVEERVRELRVLASLMTEIPGARTDAGRPKARHRS
jgi:hypothetical protein